MIVDGDVRVKESARTGIIVFSRSITEINDLCRVPYYIGARKRCVLAWCGGWCCRSVAGISGLVACTKKCAQARGEASIYIAELRMSLRCKREQYCDRKNADC